MVEKEKIEKKINYYIICKKIIESKKNNKKYYLITLQSLDEDSYLTRFIKGVLFKKEDYEKIEIRKNYSMIFGPFLNLIYFKECSF